MPGEDDPTNRAPMAWDWVDPKDRFQAQVRKLIAIRKKVPGLRYGDFRSVTTQKLIAYVRLADKAQDSALVVLNPTGESVTETVNLRIGKAMSWGELKDALTGEILNPPFGTLRVKLPAYGTRIYVPYANRSQGYTPYDRIDGKR
jgi:hypothetical protein